ncbi:MAG TPA: VanZ family protein [Anaerolineae bacterium]|nr:VanZ family protein [Anaerolineae bacterium]
MDNEERGRGTHHGSRITLWWLAVVVVAAWLLWMTLRPQEQASADLTPLTVPAAAQGISIPFLIDFLGNIVVFIPLGAAAAFALAHKPRGTRLLAATAVGAGLSAAIELLQLAIPSRVSGFDDWLLNTAGTFIGAAIASILINRRKRSANC